MRFCGHGQGEARVLKLLLEFRIVDARGRTPRHTRWQSRRLRLFQGSDAIRIGQLLIDVAGERLTAVSTPGIRMVGRYLDLAAAACGLGVGHFGDSTVDSDFKRAPHPRPARQSDG